MCNHDGQVITTNDEYRFRISLLRDHNHRFYILKGGITTTLNTHIYHAHRLNTFHLDLRRNYLSVGILQNKLLVSDIMSGIVTFVSLPVKLGVAKTKEFVLTPS